MSSKFVTTSGLRNINQKNNLAILENKNYENWLYLQHMGGDKELSHLSILFYEDHN